MPESRIFITTCVPTSSAFTRIWPPVSVYFVALLRRLVTTCFHSSSVALNQQGSHWDAHRQLMLSSLDGRATRVDGPLDNLSYVYNLLSQLHFSLADPD